MQANKDVRYRSMRWLVVLTLTLALLVVSVAPGHAAPAAQDVDLFRTPLVDDVEESASGAFVLMRQAEQAVESALRVVDINSFRSDFLDDDDLAEFRILQPTTVVTLRSALITLEAVEAGLDDFETLLEADIAEELVVSPSLLRQLRVEDDQGIFDVREPTSRSIARLSRLPNTLDHVDVDVEIADGVCGDLDTLVRVTRSDVARALGARTSTLGLGGEFGARIDSHIDPDFRLSALNTLVIRHRQIENAADCLAVFAR